MKTSDLQNKKIAILGLGIEGIALADFFDNEGIDYSLLDVMSEEKLLSRAEEDGNQGLADILAKVSSERKIMGDQYLDSLTDFDVIFRAPGIPYLHKKIQDAKEAGVKVSSQIKLFFDLCPAPIIGVTGTKGKGTTTSLIEVILRTYFGERSTENEERITDDLKSEIRNPKPKSQVFLAGNIGKPAVSLLKDIKPEDWVILELSSFQLQDLEKSPHISTVLNISVDHLDYHKDEVEYHEAKQSIAKYQSADDYAVINQDYLTSFEFAALTVANTYFFSQKDSVDEGAYIRLNIKDERLKTKEVVLRYEGEETVICRSDEVALRGDHNLANIAAAAITARIAGADIKTISKVSKSFAGLPHRIELVREVSGVKFYNDSFATNPEPTIAAVESFSEPKILILGGSSKGADFSLLAKKIAGSDVKACILIGDEANKINLSLSNQGFAGEVVTSDINNIDEAVKKSVEIAESGDVIILSPACASFGMFKNYKDRGNKFKAAVQNINE